MFSVRLGTVTSTILNQIPLNVVRESSSLLGRKVRVLYFEDEAALKRSSSKLRGDKFNWHIVKTYLI